MIFHLAVCTLTALVLVAFNALLPHGLAKLRFAILFVASIRFAVPTDWLTRAGAELASKAPAQAALFGSLATWDPPLLHAPPIAVARSLNNTVHSRAGDYSILIALLWAAGLVVTLGPWLRRAIRSIPRIRMANERELLALLNASRRFPEIAEPELRLVDTHHLPGALGLWRHQIVLPENLAQQLDQAELESVCAHELAHFARWDNLTAAVARAITAVFWFHPLVWWIERRMLVERELACDALVLRSTGLADEYAIALSKVSQLALNGRAGYASITGPNLKQRLELIMNFRTDTRQRSWRGLPSALGALMLLAPLTVAFVNAQQPRRSEPRADAMYLEANLAYSKNDYASAEKLFGQMIAEFPDDSRGTFGMAEISLANKRPEEARALLEKQLATASDKTPTHLALASVYTRTNDYASAIRTYQDLIAAEPEKAELRMRLGETYLRAGNPPEARTQFEHAAKLTPNDPASILKLALVHERLGDSTKAMDKYEAVLKLQPENFVANNNLAYLKAETGQNLDEAIVYGFRAKMLKPDNADIADTLGWVYLKKGRAADAFKEFRQALLSDANANSDRPDWRSHMRAAIDQGGALTPERAELRRLLSLDYSPETDEKIKTLLKNMQQ